MRFNELAEALSKVHSSLFQFCSNPVEQEGRDKTPGPIRDFEGQSHWRRTRTGSKLYVTVKQRDDLYREFPFHDPNAAQGYLKQLRADGYKPIVGQLEDSILVRIRTKPRPDVHRWFVRRSAEHCETHRR